MVRRKPDLCRLAVVLASSALLLSGCGSSSSSPTDLEGRLQADTGVTWLVDRDDAGAPMILTALSTPPPIASSTPRDQAAIAFFQGYADIFGVGNLADELILVADVEESLAPGAHHLRFAQRIPGSDVRVFGADAFAHFDASGSLRFAQVGFVRDIASLSAKPSRSADEARAAAEASIRAREPRASIRVPSKAPELVVYRTNDGHGRLAWRLFLAAMVDGQPTEPVFFIDAADLGIISVKDSLAEMAQEATVDNAYAFTSCARGTPPKHSRIVYEADSPARFAELTNRLLQPASPTRSEIATNTQIAPRLDEVTGNLTMPILTSDPAVWDAAVEPRVRGAAVSTHENVAKADAFFRSLGQVGWERYPTLDPSVRGRLPVGVHAWSWMKSEDSSASLVLTTRTAFYSTVDETLYFGDGDGCTLLPLGLGLDVVAHELTHGVTEHTAHLGADGEEGAISEALGDVFAAGAEHWAGKSDGDAFLIGEDVFLADGGRRNLRSPASFTSRYTGERMPSAYSQLLSTVPTDKNDHGHRHDNSTIVSHAFYLMTKGGRNPTSGLDVVDNIEWEASLPLWLRTIYTLDARYADRFLHFARLDTNVALFSFDRRVLTAAACAWRAVEVFTDADVAAYGVTCAAAPVPIGPIAQPQPPASNDPNDCAGHGDNPVCSTAQPASATICKSGAPLGVALCADPGQRCKPIAAGDPTATLSPDGALACE